MTMTMDDRMAQVVKENSRLRADLYAVTAERDALEAQLSGDPEKLPKATYWLQTKVWRQRLALQRLNRRVTAQRFALRLANKLGHIPSQEEYLAAKGDPELWDQCALEVTQ